MVKRERCVGPAAAFHFLFHCRTVSQHN
jgi:hypothetical protein